MLLSDTIQTFVCVFVKLFASVIKYPPSPYPRGMLNKSRSPALSHSQLSLGAEQVRGVLKSDQTCYYQFSFSFGCMWFIGCFLWQVGNLPSHSQAGARQDQSLSPQSLVRSSFMGVSNFILEKKCSAACAWCHGNPCNLGSSFPKFLE